MPQHLHFTASLLLLTTHYSLSLEGTVSFSRAKLLWARATREDDAVVTDVEVIPASFPDKPSQISPPPLFLTSPWLPLATKALSEIPVLS